jgi:hypothetical protein
VCFCSPSPFLGTQTVAAEKLGVNERAWHWFDEIAAINKKTGPSGQKMTERPGEFRMSNNVGSRRTPIRACYQNANRKPKSKINVTTTSNSVATVDSKSYVLIFVKLYFESISNAA